MQDRSNEENWDRETLKMFLLVEEFGRSSKSAETVSLHAPAKSCRGCEEETKILVYPSLLCGSCWVRRLIGVSSNGHSNGSAGRRHTPQRWLAIFEKYGVDSSGYLPNGTGYTRKSHSS